MPKTKSSSKRARVTSDSGNETTATTSNQPIQPIQSGSLDFDVSDIMAANERDEEMDVEAARNILHPKITGSQGIGLAKLYKPIKTNQITLRLTRRFKVNVKESAQFIPYNTIPFYIPNMDPTSGIFYDFFTSRPVVLGTEQNQAIGKFFQLTQIHEAKFKISDFVPYTQYIAGAVEAVSGSTAPFLNIGRDTRARFVRTPVSATTVAEYQFPLNTNPVDSLAGDACFQAFNQVEKVSVNGTFQHATKAIAGKHRKYYRAGAGDATGYTQVCYMNNLSRMDLEAIDQGAMVFWVDDSPDASVVNSGRITVETEMIFTAYVSVKNLFPVVETNPMIGGSTDQNHMYGFYTDGTQENGSLREQTFVYGADDPENFHFGGVLF